MNYLPHTAEPEEMAAKLKKDGYVVVQNVISEPALSRLILAFDHHMLAPRKALESGSQHPQNAWLVHPHGWIEIPRIIEMDPIFEAFMDFPLALRVATRVIGPTVELASGGEIDLKLPRSPASFAPWHRDFSWLPMATHPVPLYWIWFFYTLEDIDRKTGPVVVLPGSHTREESPRSANHDFPNGCGRPLEGSVALEAIRGSVIIFHSEVWHMSLPNVSDIPRKLIKFRYKPGWMKQESVRQIGPTYVPTQNSAVRRQLIGDHPYDKPRWDNSNVLPRREEIIANYPAAAYLFE